MNTIRVIPLNGLIDPNGQPIPESVGWTDLPSGLSVPRGSIQPLYSRLGNQMAAQMLSIKGGYGAWSTFQWPGLTGGSPEPQEKIVPKIEPRTEVVTGWREYNLEMVGSNLMLKGQYGKAWPNRFMYAACGKKHGRRIAARHLRADDCQCGIYGSGESGESGYTYESSVVAQVRAWGVVLVDQEGNFRASDVEITEMYVLRDNGDKEACSEDWHSKFIDWGRMVDLLRDRYAVPVKLVETREDIAGV